MKKKYTMEEFKEMFNEAMIKAIENLDKKMKEAQKETGRESGMMDFMFSMQNMIAMTKLKKFLFEEDK